MSTTSSSRTGGGTKSPLEGDSDADSSNEDESEGPDEVNDQDDANYDEQVDRQDDNSNALKRSSQKATKRRRLAEVTECRDQANSSRHTKHNNNSKKDFKKRGVNSDLGARSGKPLGVILNTKNLERFDKTLSLLNSDLESTLKTLRTDPQPAETQSGSGKCDKATETTRENLSLLNNKLNFYESELKRLDNELERLDKEEALAWERNRMLLKLFEEIDDNHKRQAKVSSEPPQPQQQPPATTRQETRSSLLEGCNSDTSEAMTTLKDSEENNVPVVPVI